MTTAASVVSSCIIVQLHSLSLPNVFPLPLSLSLSYSLSPPQACFLASSIFLHVIFSAISSSLFTIFGKQLPMRRMRRRQRKVYSILAPHEELGRKDASFVLKWFLSQRLSPVSVVRDSLGVPIHPTGQHRMVHRRG